MYEQPVQSDVFTEEYEKCGELLENRYAKEHAEFDIFLHELADKNGITQI